MADINLDLSEKEMRLLCNIVGDASTVAGQCKADDESEEMSKAIDIIRLFRKIVVATKEAYPIPDEDTESDPEIDALFPTC